ncbi:hypothetical protein ABPG72_016553 [Tetrahymena utriculariae]
MQGNRNSVIAFKKASYSTKQTQEELRELGIQYSKRHINRLWSTFQKDGHVNVQKPNSGRPTKYSEEDKEKIIQMVNDKPDISLKRIEANEEVKEIGMKQSTIRRVLIDNGYQAYKIPYILPLKEIDYINRVNYAKSMLQKGKRYIKSLCFSDETYFQMEKYGPQFAWVQEKTDIPLEKCLKKKQYPLSVLCWAMISNKGPLKFIQLENTMNSERYIELLENELEEGFYSGDLILQHDNARCHVSKITNEWLEENQIEVINFPSYSPDLSIVENIFGILKQEIYSIRENIENKEQLFSQLHHFFFNSEIIKKAIHSAYNNYHNWLHQVIQSQGKQLAN